MLRGHQSFHAPSSPRIRASHNSLRIILSIRSLKWVWSRLSSPLLSDECWCGNSIAGATIDLVDGDCNGPCAGDPTTKCGATFRLSVYQLAASPTTTTTTTTTSTSSAPTATYTGVLVSIGCYTDSVTVRNLNQYNTSDPNMSNALCGGICHTRGNLYSGTGKCALRPHPPYRD